MPRSSSASKLHKDYELKGVLSGDARVLRRPRRCTPPYPSPASRGPASEQSSESDSPSSVVFRGTRRRDRFEVAVKAVSKRSLNSTMRLALAREVAVHAYVAKHKEGNDRHQCEDNYYAGVIENTAGSGAENAPTTPHVAQFVEAFEDDSNLYIVTELANMGDLHSHLLECHDTTGLTEVHALKIMVQIFQAVADLHSRNIAHRDIKLENLAISGDSIDTARACLIDFGLCHIRKPGASLTSKQFVGTAGYACPEICRRKAYIPQEGDMWSLGVVLYALLTKEMPFTETSSSSLQTNIVEADVSFFDSKWKRVSRATRDLIAQLLSKDPSERPCAEDALEMAAKILNQLQ